MTDTLDDLVFRNIELLCAEADALANKGKHEKALAKYETAWVLLPEPRVKWEAATWILGAIGDIQFRKRNFASAVEALQDAMHCPNALGNPFLHLRLGESLFEMGQPHQAMDELTRAYMGAGREIFDNEDPKYFEALRIVLNPPPGQSNL